MEKLAGKKIFSLRRRVSYKKSGFKSHKNFTGKEYKVEKSNFSFDINLESPLIISWDIPNKNEQLSGFGGWFIANNENVSIDYYTEDINLKTYQKIHLYPSWSKFGSAWFSENNKNIKVKTIFKSNKNCKINFWGLSVGVIEHQYLKQNIRDNVKKRMFESSPEALFLFIKEKGNLEFNKKKVLKKPTKITLKACNRCGRFLPVNFNNESNELSFSNHCKANHLLPCKHKTFSHLNNVSDNKVHKLKHGFQLEDRYCKKLAVNAPLNPMRTAGQMKEDGNRRRFFEELLEEIYKGSPQILFKHKYNSELSEHIWEKFYKKCFKCKKNINTSNEMNLDHTRPLALLYPLDKTATCLCKTCNSSKRDRPPVEFYKEAELIDLSKITGLKLF